MKGKKARTLLLDALCMLAGSAVYAVEVNAFTAPNNIAAGGITGVATMLNYLWGTPIGLVSFLINVPIVLWAVAAWWFGIPTSESHALIAGVTGAAIALGGADGVNMGEWVKVIIGLVLSTVLGFLMGYLIVKLVVSLCRHMDRRKTDSFFKGAQITGGAAMAFMHGAQDGQKFMGVFMLGSMLASGLYVPGGSFDTKIWLMLLCSVVMSLGTSIGGYRIIKSVGMDMIKLEKYQGFSADIAAALCLLLASLTGVPVSTTHTKTTAIMGVGAAKRLSAVNWGIVKEMELAWVLTFPGCGLIGFIMAKLFMAIF